SFFFQAEDGIRAFHVTGVQTCALPIFRLGWTKLHATSRDLIGDVATLRSELAGEGIERVVLAGMGGSSLAPEVISRTEGVSLTKIGRAACRGGGWVLTVAVAGE